MSFVSKNLLITDPWVLLVIPINYVWYVFGNSTLFQRLDQSVCVVHDRKFLLQGIFLFFFCTFESVYFNYNIKNVVKVKDNIVYIVIKSKISLTLKAFHNVLVIV